MSIVVNKILSKIFKVFLKDYNKDQLDFNLFSGEATLNKIQLDEQVIHQLLGLPSTIEIKAIKCGLLKIKVPWRNLKHQPLVVYMDHIVVDIAETATPLNLPPLSKLTKLLSTIASDADEGLKEDGANTEGTSGTNTAEEGSGGDKKKKEASKDGFIQKLMEEMTINLHDIIARVTFLSSDRMSTGPEILMNLSSLCMHTTNDRWEVVDLVQARVIRKDIKSTFMYKELFVGSLNLLIKAPTIGYQEIINSKPLVVKAQLKRKFGTQMPYDINASIYNENIEITVNKKSLPQIVSSINVILWCVNQSLIESAHKQQQQEEQQSDEETKNLLITKNVLDEKKPKLPPKPPKNSDIDGGEETKDKSADDKKEEEKGEISKEDRESLLELEREIEELTAESDLEMSSDLTYDDFPIIRAKCSFTKISVKMEDFFVLNIANMCFGGTVEKVNFDDLLLEKPLSAPRSISQRRSLTLTQPQPQSKPMLRSQVICEFSIEDIAFTSLINNHSPQQEFIRVEQKPFLSIGIKFRNLVRGRQYSEDLHNLELFGQVNPVTIVVEPDFLEKMLDYVGMDFNLRHIIDFGAGSNENTSDAANSGTEKAKDTGSEDANEDANGGGMLKYLNFLENPQISFDLKKMSFMLGKNMNLSKFLFVEIDHALVSLRRYNHNSIATYTPITKEIIHKRQLEIEAERAAVLKEVTEEEGDYSESIESCSSNLLDGTLILSKISVGIVDEQDSGKETSYIVEPFDINLDFKVFRPVPLFGALFGGGNSLLDLDYKIFNKDQIPAISADLTVTKIQVSIIQSRIYKIYDDFIFPFFDFVQKAIPVFVKSATQKGEKAKMGELQPPVVKKSAGQPIPQQEQTGPAAEKLNSVKRKTAALKKLLEVRGEVAPFPFRVYLSGALGEINVLIGCQDQLTKQIVDNVLKISGGQQMNISAMLDLVYSMLALDTGNDGDEEMIHLAGVNFRSTLVSFSYVPSVPPSIKSLINLTKQQLKDNEAVDVEGRLNMKDFGIYFNPTKYLPVEVYLKPQDLVLAYTELGNGDKSEITVKNNILVSYKYEMKKCVPKHSVDLVVSGVKVGINSSLMSLFNNIQRLLVKESNNQISEAGSTSTSSGALNEQKYPELEIKKVNENSEKKEIKEENEDEKEIKTENEDEEKEINDENEDKKEIKNENEDKKEIKNENVKEVKDGNEEVKVEKGDKTEDNIENEEENTEEIKDTIEDIKNDIKEETPETVTQEIKQLDSGDHEDNEKKDEANAIKEKENEPKTDSKSDDTTEVTNETVKKIVDVGRGVTMNVEICDVELTCSEDSGKDGLGLKGSIKFTPYSNGKIEYIHNQYAQNQEVLEEKHNTEVSQLCKRIAEERKNFDNLENTLAEANVANASLRAIIDERNMEIRMLKREKAVQEKQLLQICEENIGLYKIVHGRTSSSGTQMRFQEIIKSMSTQSLAKEDEIVQLKQTIEDLQARLTEAKSETQRYSIQWDKKFEDMERAYKSEIEDLHAKLAQKDAEIARLSTVKQESITASEKMSQLEKRVKDLEEELLFSVRQNSAQIMDAISKVAKEKSARTIPKAEPLSSSERELMLTDARYKKKPLNLSTIQDLFTIDKPQQQQQQQPVQRHSSHILHHSSHSSQTPPPQPPQKPSRLSLSLTGSGSGGGGGSGGSGSTTPEAKVTQNQEQPPPIPQKPQDISKKFSMGLGKFKDKLNKGVDMIEQGGKKSLNLFKIPSGNESNNNNNNNNNSNNNDNIPNSNTSTGNRTRSGSSSKGFHI